MSDDAVSADGATQPAPQRPAPGGRGAEAFYISPFGRLARSHIWSVAGDAVITIALADSLFLSVEPDAARGRVALYLAFTMAPFALVSPLIGPAIDRARGGRRLMIVLTFMIRAVLAVLMIRHIDSFLLFPEAFGVLVMGKGYHVAKSALVPALVRNQDELIEANSKLVVISGVAGVAVAGPALLLSLVGSGAVLVLAVLVFGLGAAVAMKLPRVAVAEEPADEEERASLRTIGILLAGSSMALLRGIVGFLTFLLVFWLRDTDASPVWYGVMLAASMAGNLGGALVAPYLRRSAHEERLLGGVLAAVAVMGLAMALLGGRGAAALLALVVGLAASLGKLAFDSIVQRDAPDANQGRAFARFETRFQLVWVVGAIVPVILPLAVMPARAGFVAIGLVAGFAAFSYIGGLRAIERGERTPTDRIKAWVWTAERRQRVLMSLPAPAQKLLEGRLLAGETPALEGLDLGPPPQLGEDDPPEELPPTLELPVVGEGGAPDEPAVPGPATTPFDPNSFDPHSFDPDLSAADAGHDDGEARPADWDPWRT